VPSVASAVKSQSFLPMPNTLTRQYRGMPSGNVSFAGIQILARGGMTQMMITNYRISDEQHLCCDEFQFKYYCVKCEEFMGCYFCEFDYNEPHDCEDSV